jgi:hypothetical protein
MRPPAAMPRCLQSSYKDASMRRIVIKLSIVKPVCGSLEVVKRTLGALYAPPAAAESDSSSIAPPGSPGLSSEPPSLRGSTGGRHPATMVRTPCTAALWRGALAVVSIELAWKQIGVRWEQ